MENILWVLHYDSSLLFSENVSKPLEMNMFLFFWSQVFGTVEEKEGLDTLAKINEAYADNNGRPFKDIRFVFVPCHMFDSKKSSELSKSAFIPPLLCYIYYATVVLILQSCSVMLLHIWVPVPYIWLLGNRISHKIEHVKCFLSSFLVNLHV